MDIATSLVVIALSALIHASFQLSMSVLTLLSANTIGNQKTHRKLVGLTVSFVFGAGLMTLLLISFVTLIFMIIYDEIIPQYIWAGACGLLIGVGVSIWLFYYRREKGTMLWIPRNIAKYLTERIKATTLTAEAFSLGLSSVTAEALFIVAPITIGALTIIGLPATWQLIGLAIYTCLSISSLIIVSVAITSGNNISRIQKWRESNKYFLQFASGAGLIILSIFIYVSQILSTAIGQL